MNKQISLLLLGFVLMATRVSAQTLPCYSDEMRQKQVQAHPEILQLEQTIKQQIEDGLKHIDFRSAARTTGNDSNELGNPNFWYDIPIVIHVIHNFGTEYLTDDQLFNDLLDWNIVYAKQNYDTNSVIAPFVPYIGNPHIRLHLASKDPNGNPTKGITRTRDFSTYFGGDFSKFAPWPNNNYVNIWIVNVITTGNGEAAAYAYFPSTAAYLPYYDGIIADAAYTQNAYTGGYSVSKTINHEMGHVFNLYHPWGNTNNPQVACGDDDVDDTPPTKGHLPVGCAYDLSGLYDTACAMNYFKVYTDQYGVNDSLVNYPDTTNAQNIMDYTYCARMFTKGQAYRMHAALNSDVAGRINLWNPSNLFFTGVLTDSNNAASFAPRLDLKPIPDFSATSLSSNNYDQSSYRNYLGYFTIPGNNVEFWNETWNDTLTNLIWTFSNNATNPTVNSATSATALTKFVNAFTTPGWVDIKMQATGNNTGDTTVEWPRALFVANTSATPAAGYVQEFSGADTAQWPTFNYSKNGFKWQAANVGVNDNFSMEYTSYDPRIVTDPTGVGYAYPTTGCPLGDVDDMFSIPFDLSGYTSGNCSMNYYYSGASRSTSTLDINDTLEISYSANKSITWTPFAYISKGNLCNKGAVSTAWTPSSWEDWSLMGINIPAAARTPYTVFRFRYRPGIMAGADGTELTGSYSSGNNFYMDHLFFSQFPAGVSNLEMGNATIAVAPNPTSGDAYVIIKETSGQLGKIVVTDITGKVVFSTVEQLNGLENYVQIPHSAISVSGMYLVQVITGNQVTTKKLVVQ